MNTGAPTINLGNTLSVNFDVKEQLFTGNQKGIPIAGNYTGVSGWSGSAIGEYKTAPQSGNGLFESISGTPGWLSIPQGGNYIVTVQNGQITFVQAPSGNLQVFNNNLGWTQTEACDE
jgi:hypothetical protein